jgi:hypothetical protein
MLENEGDVDSQKQQFGLGKSSMDQSWMEQMRIKEG